jgi:hypothetical protein
MEKLEKGWIDLGWGKNIARGNAVENFLVDFLYEYYGWQFVSGNLNGKLVNKEYIENLFSCEVLEADGFSGQKIVFQDGKKITMPDMLFVSKFGYNFWVEAKSSNSSKFESIDIECRLFEDYLSIQERTKKTLWIVFSRKNIDGTENIYSVKISKLAEAILERNVGKTYNDGWKCDIYRFPIQMFKCLGSNISP